MLFGVVAIILPHSFFSIRRFGSSYNAIAHEFMRMYGALLLAIGMLIVVLIMCVLMMYVVKVMVLLCPIRLDNVSFTTCS